MCLERTREPTKKESNIQYAYKAFVKGSDNQYYYPFHANGTHPFTTRYGWTYSQNDKGFHVFKKLKDARAWKPRNGFVVTKVEIRNPTEAGVQPYGINRLECLRTTAFKIIHEYKPQKPKPTEPTKIKLTGITHT